DLANAVAGACAAASKGNYDTYVKMDWVMGPDTDVPPDAADSARRRAIAVPHAHGAMPPEQHREAADERRAAARSLVRNRLPAANPRPAGDRCGDRQAPLPRIDLASRTCTAPRCG